jgi:4'-phosphopantetheinyl transferase
LPGYPSRLLSSVTVELWLVKLTDDGPLGVEAADALLGPLPANDRRAIDDQRRSIVARAALAQLVAQRTGVDARAVRLSHDERGRPLLEGSALNVSIAHSGDYVACAVSKRRIGVDIERFDRREADDALAEHVCTPAELRQLAELAPIPRKHALIRLWARKEAVTKALGLGAALPFEQVDVSTDAPRITGLPTRALKVRDLVGGPHEYALAIATDGRRGRIRAQLIEAQSTSALELRAQ